MLIDINYANRVVFVDIFFHRKPLDYIDILKGEITNLKKSGIKMQILYSKERYLTTGTFF